MKYIRIRILKSGNKDSLRIMLVKRKIRKTLSKSLIPYFLNSSNKDKEILVKRSPGHGRDKHESLVRQISYFCKKKMLLYIYTELS